MEAIVGILGALGLVVIVILYDTLSWGYVLTKLWLWFLVPIFPMAPVLTIPQAIGLILVMSIFKARNSIKETINGVPIETKADWATAVMSPWILLLLALIIHQFI